MLQILIKFLEKIKNNENKLKRYNKLKIQNFKNYNHPKRNSKSNTKNPKTFRNPRP